MVAAPGGEAGNRLSGKEIVEVRLAQIADRITRNRVGEPAQLERAVVVILGAELRPLALGKSGARCRFRTCDPFRVKEVLYH